VVLVDAESRPRFRLQADFLRRGSFFVPRVCDERHAARSSNVAVVVVEHSTEARAATDPAYGRSDRPFGRNEIVADALVVALGSVVKPMLADRRGGHRSPEVRVETLH